MSGQARKWCLVIVVRGIVLEGLGFWTAALLLFARCNRVIISNMYADADSKTSLADCFGWLTRQYVI